MVILVQHLKVGKNTYGIPNPLHTPGRGVGETMRDKVQSYQRAQDERTEIMRQLGYEPDGYDTMLKRHPEVKKRMNMKNSHQPEGEVIDERKMTDGEMQKEKKLRKKYDKGDMKKSMKDQYGEEEGKKIYFAKIRKIAMEGKYSSGSVTYVRGHCTS